MEGSKANIIKKLKKEILPLEGYKPANTLLKPETGLGPILQAFPENRFPTGAVHEFITDGNETLASTRGFVSALSGTLLGNKGILMWIGKAGSIYPPALSHFDLNAGNIIFVESKQAAEILWATEEALRCEALTAVVCEINDLDFTASRRLLLAVESSKVTAFVLRNIHRQINTTACICRWKISSAKSEIPDGLPGVGFPAWNVELLKVRSGIPGSWITQWREGRFRHHYKQHIIYPVRKQKAG